MFLQEVNKQARVYCAVLDNTITGSAAAAHWQYTEYVDRRHDVAAGNVTEWLGLTSFGY